MKNTKKTLWIKSAAIMLAISAIFLLDAYAGKGPGGGGGGEGRNIYGLDATEADCLACHDALENPDKHHAAVVLCDDSNADGCYECVDCHELVWNDVLEAMVVSDTDCLGCHDIADVEGPPGDVNVHHDIGLGCVVCHGF